VIREEDRVQRCEGNERRLTNFERFICKRENFVFDSLIYLIFIFMLTEFVLCLMFYASFSLLILLDLRVYGLHCVK